MDERIGVAQIVEETVSQAFAHVCARHETSDVEKLDRYRAASFYTCAIVGFTSVGEAQTCAGAFYLEVANGSLGVDCREAERMGDML